MDTRLSKHLLDEHYRVMLRIVDRIANECPNTYTALHVLEIIDDEADTFTVTPK